MYANSLNLRFLGNFFASTDLFYDEKVIHVFDDSFDCWVLVASSEKKLGFAFAKASVLTKGEGDAFNASHVFTFTDEIDETGFSFFFAEHVLFGAADFFVDFFEENFVFGFALFR